MGKIAFLGLGHMGAPMARHFLDAGHPLTVWNHTPEKAAPLVEPPRSPTAPPTPTW